MSDKERISFALVREERLPYKPVEGWNLEVSYSDYYGPKILLRLVKYGNYLELSPLSDELLGKGGKYTAYKIAWDLKESCFVLNPREAPGDAWQEYTAFTTDELEFHLKRNNFPPIDQVRKIHEVMNIASVLMKEQQGELSKASKMIIDPILEKAGVPKPSSWAVDREGESGYDIYRRHTGIKNDKLGDLIMALENTFPHSVRYSKRKESWQTAGESIEQWAIYDPDKLLELQTGISHSSLILSRYNGEFPHNNLTVVVARPNPLIPLFWELGSIASYSSLPDQSKIGEVEKIMHS